MAGSCENGFQKMRRIFLDGGGGLSEELLACQEGL